MKGTEQIMGAEKIMRRGFCLWARLLVRLCDAVLFD